MKNRHLAIFCTVIYWSFQAFLEPAICNYTAVVVAKMKSLVLFFVICALGPGIVSSTLIDQCPGLTPPTAAVGYNSFRYSTDNDNNCDNTELVCEGSLDVAQINDRTWFMTNNVEFDGLAYPREFIQQFNVQCPANSFLHLFPQRLQTERATGGGGAIANCIQSDFVRVTNPEIVPGENSEIFCGGQEELEQTSLFNGGLGRIVTNGNATVEFCTNSNSDFGVDNNDFLDVNNAPYNGFVVRATCVDPRNLMIKGCVRFSDHLDYFRDLVASDLRKPDLAEVPHKRSVEEIEEDIKLSIKKQAARERQMEKRFKRFNNLMQFELFEGDTVTFVNGKITLTRTDGSDPFCPDANFFCVQTFSNFVGSRLLFRTSPLTFRGPGKLILDQIGKFNIARLFYTVDSNDPRQIVELLLPGASEMAFVNRVYEYIFDCYVSPLPVAVNDRREVSLGLPDARNPNPFTTLNDIRFKSSETLTFLQESNAGGTEDGPEFCRRGILIRRAPLLEQPMDPRLFSACQLLWRSCSPIIATACRELLNLDPLYNG